MSPIPQINFLIGTFFAVSDNKPALESLCTIGFARYKVAISFEIVFARKLKCDFSKALAPLCTTSFALHHLQSLLLLILYLLNAAFDTLNTCYMNANYLYLVFCNVF